MRDALEDCRRRFGSPGTRTAADTDRAYLRSRRPLWLWMRPTDFLNRIYRSQQRLIREGKIVWGCIVQANVQMFKPGSTDCPASCIYSPDASFESDVEALFAIAQSLYEVKGEQAATPELQAFSRILADELDRAPGLRVPHALTGGRDVFHTAIMIMRKHLPQGYLANGYFPLLVDPADWKTAMILPARYWSPLVIEDWAAAGR